jgi:hypothetical protein
MVSAVEPKCELPSAGWLGLASTSSSTSRKIKKPSYYASRKARTGNSCGGV